MTKDCGMNYNSFVQLVLVIIMSKMTNDEIRVLVKIKPTRTVGQKDTAEW
jgi:hypothetical protein